MAHVAHLPLSERTRPARLDDVLGNPRARRDLRAWADRWRSGTPPAMRAALLYGPPGVGKTSAALALAADLGWTVVEMNASDARNEHAIEQVAGRASITHTLGDPVRGGGPRRALIVLDEADSMSGRATETPRVARTPVGLREFLRSRYGSIESLNQAWGLSPNEKPAAFESWDAVPRSPGNFAWARKPLPRRDLDEWRGLGKAPDSSDRGGMAAIARLVKSTRQPVVLIANDERVLSRYSAVFRTGVARIRFDPVDDRELARHLAGLAARERIPLAPGALDAIVRRSRGDLRAAVNDLEAIAPLPATEVQLQVLGFRDLTADFEAVTDEALSVARFFRSVEIRDRLDAPPDDLLPWIEENIPHFAPDAAHRAAAFDRLAVAERLLQRARRWRVWSLWSYATEVLTGGVGLSIRDGPTPLGRRPYFPGFLGAMGRTRAARATRDAIAGKSGARLHLSRAKARDSVLPFLEEILRAGATAPERAGSARRAAQLVRELELTPEEVAYLLDVPPDTAAVSRLTESPETAPEDPAGPGGPAPVGEAGKPVQRTLSEFGGR
jgi:DNA polymerase III delta prime subunit